MQPHVRSQITGDDITTFGKLRHEYERHDPPFNAINTHNTKHAHTLQTLKHAPELHELRMTLTT